MTFLIVEDSRPTRNLIKSYLSEINIGQKCFFFEVEDGESTLRMLPNGHIDFILLDWNLSSDMTGLDVLKAIRKIDKFKSMPIIMITGDTDKEKVIESIKYGANDFISKPIDKKLFAEKILKAAANVKL